MRWVRWVIAVAAALALAGASAPQLGPGGSGGGALPMPTRVQVGSTAPIVPATPSTADSRSPVSDQLGPAFPPPIAQLTHQTEPATRLAAQDPGGQSPVPWVLFGVLVITAGAAVATWWRRRRALG